MDDDKIDGLPDVTTLCGRHRMDDAKAAFEHYRSAWDIAEAMPSIPSYRAVVAAHDKLMGIIKGADDEQDPLYPSGVLQGRAAGRV